MELKIVYYIFALLAVGVFIFSIQFKRKKDILLAQTFANFFYSISYLVLNAYSAVVMNFISAIRAYIFYLYAKKRKKPPFYLLFIFIVSILIILYFVYKDLYSLIPPLITIAYFISTYCKNPKVIRVVFLVCGFIWIFYNLKVGAYVALIGNSFEIISGIIALRRFRNVKK